MEDPESESSYEFGQRQQLLLHQYLEQHPSQKYPKNQPKIIKPQLILTQEICNRIRQQVEFYLSPVNILDDFAIRKQLNKNKGKWLKISYLLGCNKLRNILKQAQKFQNTVQKQQTRMKGLSKRSKVRMLSRVLSKSPKLVVNGNKIRGIQANYVNVSDKNNKKEKKTGNIVIEDTQKKYQKNKEKLFSNKERERMLYIEFGQNIDKQEIIQKINTIANQSEDKNVIQLGKNKQKIYIKNSSNNSKWILLFVTQPSLKIRIFTEFQTNQNYKQSIKVIDGQSWIVYHQKYIQIQKQLSKYLQNATIF